MNRSLGVLIVLYCALSWMFFFFLNQSNLNNRWCKMISWSIFCMSQFRKRASSVWSRCQTCSVHSPGEKQKRDRNEEIWLFCFTCLQMNRGGLFCILLFTVHRTMMLFELSEFSITHSFMGNWQITWTCTTNFIWMYKWIFIF